VGTVIKLPDSPLGSIRPELAQVLTPNEYLFTRELLEAFFYLKAGGHTNTEYTAKQTVQTVQDFVAYSGKAPWNLTEADFNKWCFHIGKERRALPSTQRKYQGQIGTFYKFMTRDDATLAKIRTQFQARPRQIVHEENRIPHTVEDERSKPRTDVIAGDLAKMFQSLDEEIRVAYRFKSKALFPLMRDKALFYTIFACGLRASEALRLDSINILPDPENPKFGEYGILIVFGKGNRGSGLRRREFVVEDPEVPRLLDWYLKNVRPRFLAKCKIGEQAIFLSQQGKRLCLASLELRFSQIMSNADMSALGYVPHSLRHSSVTQKMMKYSLEATRRMHGHVNGYTTQRYAHIPDELVAEEIRRVIRENIRQAEARNEGGD